MEEENNIIDFNYKGQRITFSLEAYKISKKEYGVNLIESLIEQAEKKQNWKQADNMEKDAQYANTLVYDIEARCSNSHNMNIIPDLLSDLKFQNKIYEYTINYKEDPYFVIVEVRLTPLCSKFFENPCLIKEFNNVRFMVWR